MYCSKCGKEVAETDSFCAHCGAKLNHKGNDVQVGSGNPNPGSSSFTNASSSGSAGNSSSQSTPSSVIHEAKAPKKKSGLKRFFLWATVIIVGVIGFAIYLTSGMVDVVNLHLTALKAGNMEQAYSLVSKRFQQSTSQEQFNAFVANYPILQQHTEFSAGDREFSGESGYVEGTLSSDALGSAHIEFQMIKEGDSWRIQGFELD